jgi:hypothetical protein
MVTAMDKRFENGLYTLPPKQATGREYFTGNYFIMHPGLGSKIKILYNRNILYNYTNTIFGSANIITSHTE